MTRHSVKVSAKRMGDEAVLAPQVDLVNALTSPTSFSLPDNMPIETWSRLGTQLFRFSEASCWWIGDWLVYGETKYRDRYKRAMSDTSLDYKTLRNYSWVARRFDPSRRRTSLTFQHHVEVAALPPEEQDYWLDMAEKFEWSRNELRRQLKASYSDDSGYHDHLTVRVTIKVREDQAERWEAAASQRNYQLIEWISIALDEIASRSLDE
jgi:hypothetical protein